MPGSPETLPKRPGVLAQLFASIGVAHDRLLDLTEEIADENPFAALTLLQTCGISRFGHVSSAVPPALAQPFAKDRDEAIAATLSRIH